MRAGVALEPWKLPTFKRHLDAAGYTYEESELSPGMAFLTIECGSAEVVAPIIKAAMDECRKSKLN